MADDLATLHQFGVFQDEEEVRLEVAARVVASSSRAAIEDEEKVQQAWRALEQAEHRVSELEGELDDATRAAAEEASPLLATTTTTAANAPSSSVRRVSDIRFQLNAAKRELSRADAAVRKVQVEVERRQAARLAEAKRKEKESLAAEQQQQQQHQPQQPTGSAAATTTVARRIPAPAAAADATSTNGSPRSALNRASTPNGAATPAGTRTTTTRVLFRAPQHLRGVTRSDYSGGDVLPSLSRVQVTRADIRSKQRRYQDDTDMEHFVDRIAKRQRLESVAYQQRRRAAETMTTPLSATIGAAAGLKKEEGALQVKEEPGTTSRTRRSTTAKKKEEEKTTQQQVKVEDSVSGSDDDDGDVIDVDALMEDDDDAAVAAAVDRAATQLQRAGNSQDDRSRSATPLASQSSQADAAGPADLTVEMEEVTLMPGVRMDAVIHSRLLDYQQEGLLWLLSLHSRRAGGILGDEMGLGKTIQVAALINALHHSSLLRGPVLIVAPMTVLRQWLAELHRWAPYVRSCVMHESGSSGSAREPFLRSVQGTPAVVITTFSAMREHCGMLQRTGFQYVILDEGHKISNPEAGVTLAAKSFTTPHRLILSGSPIQNSLKELWCLFDFVRPGLLGTMNRFIDEFETPIAQSRNVRATPLALATAVECAKTLQSHIAPFLLRRLKRQVNTQLPPKYERVLRVPLTDQQLEQYLQVLTSPVVQRLFAQTVMYGSSYGGLDRDGRDSTGSLHVAGARLNMATRRNNSGVRLESFRLMNQLRQICNHADIYAVQRGADEEDRMTLHRGGSLASQLQRPPQRSGKYQHRSFRSNNPVNLLGSGKLNALLMMLKEWKSFGHRVLVFSQTRMMLDIIENMCEQQSYTYIRMDGMTSGHHRQELMDRFNEDPNIFVALLTTRVGGIGVNLIGADRVVIFDPDWNPITDVQARERAWRIGQRREVCVYRLITSGSVEESILRRQLAKMYVTDKVLNDPELQRFFHVQDSFMESFLLGSEYEARVPLDKRYLLTAHQLNKSAASASARRGPQVDESLGDYGGAADDEEKSSEEVSDAEEKEVDVVVANGAAVKKAEQDVQPTRAERDFGLLVPVKDEADDANTTGVTASSREGDAAASARPAKGRGETQLLQGLVDQQDVVVAGSDRVAQRLARRKAEEMIRRVSSQQSVLEVMREQQRQFSLRSALEAKKAEEAAEREEQRQYYKEELAAEAATKRRRL